MKYLKIEGLFFFTVVALVCINTACTKEKKAEPIGEKGQTIVKLFNGLPDTLSGKVAGYSSVNVDLVSTPQIFAAAEVRRDVPSNAELNKKMVILIKNDPGIVSQYDPALTPLPDGAFTVDVSTPLVGTEYHVTMNPGEFAKVITVTI